MSKKLRVSSGKVQKNKVRFLAVSKDAGEDQDRIKQELLIMARLQFGYPEAELDDIEEIVLWGKERYVFRMSEDSESIHFDDKKYNVVPVETVLVRSKDA